MTEFGNFYISGIAAIGTSLISFPAGLKASSRLGFVQGKVVTVCGYNFSFCFKTYRTGVSF